MMVTVVTPCCTCSPQMRLSMACSAGLETLLPAETNKAHSMTVQNCSAPR